MAADPNMGFRRGNVPASFCNRHMLSFQPEAVNIASAGMFDPGTISNLRAVLPAGVSPGSVLPEPLPGLRHDTGLAADWSFNEQAILREGLARHADEPSMMQYIKIAATLPDKTVRDVALRCRYMNKKEYGKRRKPEEHYAGKKLKDRKENMVDYYVRANTHMVNSDNMTSYSFMHHANRNDRFSCEAPALDDPTWNLMDENAQVFSQIASNLATFKIQDNIELFRHTRNNIAAILNRMSDMPGIMSQMPALPVSLDEQLLSTILRGTSQARMFGAPGGIYLKQEPRC